jgi:hypothetical protein
MRAKILCHRNEKKINQKFVWLKVASVNICRFTVPDCVTFLMLPFLFVVDQNDSFFTPKLITFQENHFQIT